MAFKCVLSVLNIERMDFHYSRHTQSSNKVLKQACVYMARKSHPPSEQARLFGKGNIKFPIAPEQWDHKPKKYVCSVRL